MSSPTSTPSHFDRLPTELLKHIVVLVHKQDQEFRKSGMGGTRVTDPSKKRKRVYDSDSEDLDSPPPVIRDSKFSTWHGRGLHAISLLNKRLRELCLPFLCPVAKAQQFASGLYRFGVIPQAILNGVRRIDLHTASLSKYVAAAVALPQLPNVDTLEISLRHQLASDMRYVAPYYPEASSPAFLATKAFRNNASRISTLVYLSNFADTGTLLRLEFRNPGSTLFEESAHNYSSSIRLHVLTMLPCLTHLDLSSAPPLEWDDLLSDDATWPDEARFPALRDFSTKSLSWSVFHFVEKCMARLVKLDVFFPTVMEPSDPLPSSPTLHHLEALSITGPLHAFAILAQLSLPRVRTIDLTFALFDWDATLDCTAILPPDILFARRVSLRIATPPTTRLKNVEAFANWCERRDIDLSWTPGSRLAVFDQPLTISADDTCMSNTADAVLDTLAWASDHGKRLCDVGDAAGLRELAELVKPLCERRIIEEM
ncbi:Proteophosphoglycan ppg4 [Rhodotorula toruloides]